MWTKLIISTKSKDKNQEISHTRRENRVSCSAATIQQQNQQQEKGNQLRSRVREKKCETYNSKSYPNNENLENIYDLLCCEE